MGYVAVAEDDANIDVLIGSGASGNYAPLSCIGTLAESGQLGSHQNIDKSLATEGMTIMNKLY